MKRLLILALVTSALCACQKSNTDASSQTKQGQDSNNFTGAWMNSEFRAAYDIANSQSADMCTQLKNTEKEFVVPDSYILVDKEGSVESCSWEKGIAKNESPTPIPYYCEKLNDVKIDQAASQYHFSKPECVGDIRVQGDLAILVDKCSGKPDVTTWARITPDGYKTYVNAAKSCADLELARK